MSRTNNSSLRIGHLNVRSLERHIDGVKVLLHPSHYHFFAVTETMLRPSSPMGPIRVPGYNFVRHSLPTGRGNRARSHGGVGLYVQKGIKAVPIIRSLREPGEDNSTRLEYLAVQSKINNHNICVVVVYNPTGSNPLFVQHYEKLLLDLQEFDFDRIYLVGDYNINVAANHLSGNAEALARIHSFFNLTILPTAATRITEQSATTIDLLVTDSPSSIRTSKTQYGSSISDHEVVYLIADIHVPSAAPQTMKVRNMRGIDIVRLQADFQAIDLQDVYETNDVNRKVEITTTKLQSLLETHAPEKVIQVRDKRTPWITRGIEQAIAVRDLAYALYARNPNRTRNSNQWREYVQARDRAKTLITNAKKQYADRNFSADLPAKQLWSNLRREGVHNNEKKATPSNNFDAHHLNQFFTEGHLALPNSRNATVPVTQETAPAHVQEELNFQPTSVEEVARRMFEISSNATGSDHLPISFVKMLSPFILPLLTHIFNTIIAEKTFPSSWKKAVVTPIPKSGNPTAPKDFRPISVLPSISKILEKILLAQISYHLDVSNPHLMAAHQSGYRRGYSTTTALTEVTHNIYQHLDNQHCTIMVLVDFSLAFNCVKHRILLDKLSREFGFSPAACDLISSFLNQRRQTVKHGDATSEDLPLIDGTPQGSCLSAMLFSLFINSLPSVLKCKYQLYADDLQIYVSGPISQVDRLVDIINRDLISIEAWTRHNMLTPNPKKTQAIVFSREGNVIPQNDIVFCGEPIQLSDKVTNLGLAMDKRLCWTDQVNDVVKRVYSTLRTFRRFQSVLSLATRKKLVQAVIVPLYTYCDVVYYSGLTEALKQQLHRSFKSAVRFVYGLRRRDTTEEVRHTILGRDLLDNYKLRVCCFLRRGYLRELPPYLLQHLQPGANIRARSFVLPHHTTSSGKSVLISGASLWNHLPLALKQKPTLTAFKSGFQ